MPCIEEVTQNLIWREILSISIQEKVHLRFFSIKSNIDLEFYTFPDRLILIIFFALKLQKNSKKKTDL